VVHIIDREADSVLFMRELQEKNSLFLIRVKDNAKVYWDEKQCEIKQKVNAQTIAKWYYYRWNIESYFKLLKTTGFNFEKWQQEKPLALFKRLKKY
jgi:hypothetical protein